MSKTKIPIQNQKIAYTVIRGEAALVNPKSSLLHWLNPVATRIWELSDGKHSAEAISKILCEEFEVSQEQALQDTESMIEAFTDKGMLEVR